MRYLSLFSGIEAATVAWEPLGWECVGVAEVEPFPSALLGHYYPVPNLGDVTKITEIDIAGLGHIDLIVFGSPCQDLSVAGKRAGLEGARSGLFHTAISIIKWARRHCGLRFALWENVPGAFSSNKGRDFASVVGKLAGCGFVPVPPKGWGNEGAIVGRKGMVEWSTLDAQWFGVAQRRRRVFAFADFGNWSGRPPVLLEPESLRGDSAPCRQAGKDTTHDIAPCIGASGRGFERGGDTRGQDPVVAVAFGGNNCSGAIDVAAGLNAKSTMRGDFETETFIGFYQTARQPEFGNFNNLSPMLNTEPCSVAVNMQVRRLTPRECERLQGFPDDYTLITMRNKPAADGPRYKALGNSMCTNVMRWIGEQIEIAGCFQRLTP